MFKKDSHSINYDQLAEKTLRKTFKYSEVKDKLVSVAFDIVKFPSEDQGANLWRVLSADDGQYIVALYEESPDDLEKTASLPWSVSASNTHLSIAYKGDPLVRLSSAQLGIPASELHRAEQYLPSKLATNKKLVQALLSELNTAARQEVANRYPELA
jgi:hypothetical protein